jgi:anti-sigma-K factor RskA
MAMDKEQFEELCAAYVLEALDEDDHRLFEAALAEADQARRQVYTAMRTAALHLPLTAEVHEPASHVKDKILQTVRPAASPQKSEEGSIWDRLAVTIGLATPRVALSFSVVLAVVIVGLSYYAVSMRSAIQNQQQQLAELQGELVQKQALLEVLTAPVIEMVMMNGLEVNPTGYGKIIWDPGQGIAILQLANLPPTPADKDYQLWVIRAGTPISAGVFAVRETTEESFFKIDDLAETDKQLIDAFAITIEPSGGVPQPTGDMYLLGHAL